MFNKKALLVIGLLASAGGANAQYVDVDAALIKEQARMSMEAEKQKEARNDAAVLDNIEIQGNLTPSKVVVKAKKNVNLIDAMQSIMPASWGAQRLENVDVDKKVNLVDSAKDWTVTLGYLLEQAGLKATVDAKDKIVLLKNNFNDQPLPLTGGEKSSMGQKEQAQPAAPVAQAAPKAQSPLVKNDTLVNEMTQEQMNEKAVAAAVSSPVAAPQPVFRLTAGKTLRENVTDWAAKSNPAYTVVWKASDYMITVPAAFDGQFDDTENGALVKLLKVFESHDVRLRGAFKEQNRTLVIYNYTYSQAQ